MLVKLLARGRTESSSNNNNSKNGDNPSSCTVQYDTDKSSCVDSHGSGGTNGSSNGSNGNNLTGTNGSNRKPPRRSHSSNAMTNKMSPHIVEKFRDLVPAFLDWAEEIKYLDPRYQILEFFNDVAQSGADEKVLKSCEIHDTGVCTAHCFYDGRESEYSTEITKRLSLNRSFSDDEASLLATLNGCFDRAGIFSVWRPTSLAAIRKMIRGEGVGKGLDIKGKSAKRGKLSAFVPVLQISGDKHKHMLRTIPKSAGMRLYFLTRHARDLAHRTLQLVSKEMKQGYAEAQEFLKEIEQRGEDAILTPEEDQQREEAMSRYNWEMDDITIYRIDKFALAPQPRFGLDISQRLFLEAYIIRGDCLREPGSENDIGRPSQPAFQDMNLETLRKVPMPIASSKTPAQVKASMSSTWGIRCVALQYNSDPQKAMDPKDLVMAYEEHGRVLPVVSDFDCFLIGTRRVKYKQPLPKDQVAMMQWTINNIEKVLEAQESGDGSTWTMQWLEILKQERLENGFKPSIPRYGYADPKSYSIMAHAVDRLAPNGAVRHGAEAFNYYFPQELDDEFLVISNYQHDAAETGTLIPTSNRWWMKLNANELKAFLSTKIDEGFMFPLNPKWILADPGWKELYDRQLKSSSKWVQKAIRAWYPAKSGIRKRIEQVHKKYPNGFVPQEEPKHMTDADGIRFYSPLRMNVANGENADVSLALMELEHHDKLHKAKRVVRAIIAANRLRPKKKKVLPANVKHLMVGDIDADDDNATEGGDRNCVIL